MENRTHRFDANEKKLKMALEKNDPGGLAYDKTKSATNIAVDITGGLRDVVDSG